MRQSVLILFIFTVILQGCISKVNRDYDIIVAGGGTGGVSAAIQAARLGCRVLLLEETDWLGGQMSAAGVGTMDEGTPHIRRSGIYNEFCSRVSEYYRDLGMVNNVCYFSVNSFSVEPHVAQKVLYDMINEVNSGSDGCIDVKLTSKVTEVLKEGRTVNGVKVESGIKEKEVEEYGCTVLIDATEYGDVIPLSGARYRIAKHTSDSVDLSSNVQDFTWTAIVKEYKDGIPDNLKMNVKPRDYEKYIRHLSYIRNYANDGYNVYANPTSWNSIAHYRGMPDSGIKAITDSTVKTELNIAQNDVPMKVKDCIDPDARFLREIELRNKTLALLYYIQNELGLNWSVDPNEKFDTPFNIANTDRMIAKDSSFAPYRDILVHFPVMAYVRESVRIIGEHTLISTEIDRTKEPHVFYDAISINDYPEDLHGSKKMTDMDVDIDPGGKSAAEAHDWNSRTGPFQVPLRAFIPESVDGLIAAEKNISQSRLVNGATRLQPSTMINGQAAGNLAALSVKYSVPPREIPHILVQWEQLKAKSPIWFKQITDIPVESESWNYAQLALAYGYLEMPGNRFFPQDPVSAEDLERIKSEYGFDSDEYKNQIVTRIELSRILIDTELEKAWNN